MKIIIKLTSLFLLICLPVIVAIHYIFILIAIPFLILGHFFSNVGNVVKDAFDMSNSAHFVAKLTEKLISNLKK